MMIPIRLYPALVYFFFFMLWVALCSIPVYLFKLLGARRLEKALIHLVAHNWGRQFSLLVGARVTVKGLEYVPMDAERLCVICNHQSLFDILVVLGWYPRTVGFIAKREIIAMPVINFWLKIMGSVFIDRRNIRKAAMAIEKGIESIKRGNPVLIFPEGTRSRSAKMGPLKPGALKLATRSKAVISPVTVDGTFRLLEEHGQFRPAAVSMTIHPPIDTAVLGEEERKKLPERLAAVLASALPAQAAE